MRCVKQMIQWLSAIALGFCLVNLLCFAYERPTGWIDTPYGPSPAGWNPGSVLVHGTEGYGIARVDESGYLNPTGVLREGHILCMGSSHTQGTEVAPEKKYTALLNAHFTEGAEKLAAYNISCYGNFLPSLIRHFPMAVKAFPDASVMVMELSRLDFTDEQLEDAMQPVSFGEIQSVPKQKETLGIPGKLKIFLKEYLPLLNLIKTKMETAAEAKETEADLQEELSPEVIHTAIRKIRSEFDGHIVVVYHPPVEIQTDGTISLRYDVPFDAFRDACAENDIILVDMGPVFLDNYEQEQTLPYGFANTVPGTGHLNTTGHRLIAEALIEVIGEVWA